MTVLTPTSLPLVRAEGNVIRYECKGTPLPIGKDVEFRSRIAYAAAHVVVDPIRTTDPMFAPCVDWERTLAYREHLWSLGFSVAEAMDTSQRGMGLSWPTALELIQRSARLAKIKGGGISSGAGTDHLDLSQSLSLDDVIAAYEMQCAAVEAAGSRIILMASRALAKVAGKPEDYRTVYGHILRQVREPVILHWLGPMFDPALKGYWGCADIGSAMEECLELIHKYADKVDGIKISLLDAEAEVSMRRRLPAGVRMYTGDDFNYDRLIAGDDHGYSDALLGIFDAIAPAASLALQAFDEGDLALYKKLLEPTVALSRQIFAPPTFYYKTGIVFLAWLNGYQDHFRMIQGHESARSVVHLCELFRLADQAGLLRDPHLSASRMTGWLATAGVA